MDAIDLKTLDNIMIGGYQDDDGQWCVTVLLNKKDGSQDIRRIKQKFSSREEAYQYAHDEVMPQLQRMGVLHVIDVKALEKQKMDYLNDPDRPQGLRCGAYEVEGKRKVFCGKPSVWSLEPKVPISFCDEHHAEFLAEFPDHKDKFSRIQ
jgi:hypothetical protein